MLIGAFPSRGFPDRAWPNRGWPGYALAPTNIPGLAFAEPAYLAKILYDRDEDDILDILAWLL